MRTMGLSLGLTLLCLLCVQAEDPKAAELDESKIAGTWYITAMASDSESYLQNKDHLKMAMANIEVLGNGELKVSFAIPTPEKCMKFESIYKPTGTPGEYYSSDRGNKTVQLVDTDGKTYMVVFATREKDGKTLHMLRLYSKRRWFRVAGKAGAQAPVLYCKSMALGRTQWVRPKIKLLFKRLAKLIGFTDQTIWILPRQEECSLGEV